MASRLQRQLQLLSAHLVVALVALVVIGGATRVMQAGLACPDWPLCYGSFLPGRQMNLQVFLEWFHRLDAFVVGIGMLVLATTAVLQRQHLPRWLPWLSGACLVLVAFQGALGALTVTLLLPAAIVTAHLATALLLVMLVSVCHQLLEAGAVPIAAEAPARSSGGPERPAGGLVPGPGSGSRQTAPPHVCREAAGARRWCHGPPCRGAARTPRAAAPASWYRTPAACTSWPAQQPWRRQSTHTWRR